MQMQGKPKGLEGLWILKGQVKPPRHRRLRLVLSVPRLTRVLLRQGPTPHLSKSEVSWLADQGAALGHGTKLLTYPKELGFLTTHSGAEFGRGRSSNLCMRSASPVQTRKNLMVVRKKMDRRRGAEAFSVTSATWRPRIQTRERKSAWKIVFVLYDCADRNGVASFLLKNEQSLIPSYAYHTWNVRSESTRPAR